MGYVYGEVRELSASPEITAQVLNQCALICRQLGFRFFSIDSVQVNDRNPVVTNLYSNLGSVGTESFRREIRSIVQQLEGSERRRGMIQWRAPEALPSEHSELIRSNKNEDGKPALQPTAVSLAIYRDQLHCTYLSLLFGSSQNVKNELDSLESFGQLVLGCFDRSQAPDPSSDFGLSKREVECLKWTSRGKTSAELAVIMGLSEHTVNAYISHAGVKLNTVNRVHTVGEAIRRGIIS